MKNILPTANRRKPAEPVDRDGGTIHGFMYLCPTVEPASKGGGDSLADSNSSSTRPVDAAGAFVERRSGLDRRKGPNSNESLLIERHRVATESKDREISMLKQELAQARADLKTIKSDLEEERFRRDTLVAGMATFNYLLAHDLKGPLSHIASAASLISLRHAHEIPQAVSLRLVEMVAESKSMGHLIDDLVRLSDLRDEVMTFEDVDLGVEAERALLMEHGVATSVQDGGMIATADARMIRIVIRKLIKKASHHASKREDGYIRVGSNLERIDAGDSAHQLRRVFFVQANGQFIEATPPPDSISPIDITDTNTRRAIDRTSVGMKMCERIIERHGGQIWAEGLPGGEGVVVKFFLDPAGAGARPVS